MCASDTPRRAGQRGTSLIELLVGIVVALLIGLVAMGMAISYAATQRQAVGTSSATSSGASAIEMLRTQTLPTGLGFFGSSSFRCERLNLSHGSTVLGDGAAFSPLNVTRPSSGLFDTLDVMYASSVYGGTEVPLLSASATAASLKAHLPASTGQVVLLSPVTAGAPCTVRSVTGITAATADTYEQLSFGSSGSDGAYNQATFSASTSYAAGDRIALLGALSAYRYSVADNKLQQTDRIAGTTATLARNVMAFRVQYGTATSTSSRALDSWVNPNAGTEWATVDSTHLGRILAMRVQLLLRSPQPEKPNASTGACEATTTAPTLMTGESYALAAADKCYRYRLVSTVIPLRNITGGLK
jgi:type IV pilus assembly protein PilW